MKKGTFLLRRMLITGVLGLVVFSVYAQDTAIHKKSSFHSEGEKKTHSQEVRSSAFGFPSEIRVSPKKSEQNKGIISHKRPDSLFHKKDSGKVVGKLNRHTVKDTIHQSSTPIIPLANAPDTGNKNKLPSPVQKPAPLPTFSMPSFTGRSFVSYGEFVNYLLTGNAVFKNVFHNQPNEIILRVRGNDDNKLKSHLFYVIFGLIMLLAVLKLLFTKYFSNLFRAFFYPTLSRRQLREQLSQAALPALLLNIFFAASAGLYVFLILSYFHYITVRNPLRLIPVLILLMMVIYLIKYIFIQFSGWLFGFREVASGYIFTLFMVNKILGIGLLPFILILAFCSPEIALVALNISVILILLLFIYRYIRIISLARNEIIFNKFHFFIYLCAFEIAPILIIGKVVLIWLNGA